MESELARKSADVLLGNLVRSSTDLTEEDIEILLEVSHTLPIISNLENGDTYINVMTKTRESVVVAQHRHPDCDLYKRNIIGQIETRTDEPAVFRALAHGIAGRGLIGMIDGGRIMVRHTVSPIYNHHEQVIGALTFEYPSDQDSDTEPIRLRMQDEDDSKSLLLLRGEIDKVAGYMRDGFLAFDKEGNCTFANDTALDIYRQMGFEEGLHGKNYKDLHLKTYTQKKLMDTRVLKNEAKLGDKIYEEKIHAIWEGGEYRGIAVILCDKTKIRQMEDELAYRIAIINEIHHRVKNNLQTIVSLVGLEAAQSKNEEIKAFAKTIVSRICSISVTYDMLAHTSTDCVNLKTMLIRVVEGSVGSSSVGESMIQTKISGDDLELPANVASTIALVVNELVQNSLKYAFGNCPDGKIMMTIERGSQFSWITVQDNGCGFDRENSKQKKNGLGLKLIESLVKSSLKGDIIMESNYEGTMTKFSFCNDCSKTKLQK